MDKRSAQRVLRQRRETVRRQGRSESAVDFFNLLTGQRLLEVTESHLPEHRERLYPPTVTLSMFIKQTLEDDGSCQRAVNGWAAQRAAEGLAVQSIHTGAYCQARQRLPTAMVSALTREVGAVLCAGARKGWRWRGRKVKLVDGTGISMPDTQANQEQFPQPSTQAEGVGFPLIRLVGIICLSTGAIQDVAFSEFEGKGRSEHDLFRTLLDTLSAGDVVLGDALYSSYWLMAALHERGVDFLFEQNGTRKTDFRCGHRLGKGDHTVRLRKPKTRPYWMTREQYALYPSELLVREIDDDGRVLITSLLKPRQTPRRALCELYAQRWHIELDLRNIKTTLGMEALRCRSPEMVVKELWVNLLAYNLIRLLMAQAAAASELHPRELSFKHTVQMWLQWPVLSDRPVRHRLNQHLFTLLAQISVGRRPGRLEPRARKRRPKSYPWLKVPRQQARQQIRTLGYLPNG